MGVWCESYSFPAFQHCTYQYSIFFSARKKPYNSFSVVSGVRNNLIFKTALKQKCANQVTTAKHRVGQQLLSVLSHARPGHSEFASLRISASSSGPSNRVVSWKKTSLLSDSLVFQSKPNTHSGSTTEKRVIPHGTRVIQKKFMKISMTFSLYIREPYYV